MKATFLGYEIFREGLLFSTCDLELGTKTKGAYHAAQYPLRFSTQRTNPSVYGSFFVPR